MDKENKKTIWAYVKYLIKFRELSKAIQLVAISKLRAYKTRIESRELALHLVVDMFPMHTVYDYEVCTVIVIMSDRNCCGSLNSNVWSAAKVALERYVNEHVTLNIIAVGYKCRLNVLKKHKRELRKTIDEMENGVSLLLAYVLALCIFDMKFDTCAIYFSKYYRIFEQFAVVYEFRSYNNFIDYAYINRKNHIFFEILLSNNSFDTRTLYYYNICIIVLDALEETKYSEFGSRAFAMEMAHRNATALLQEQLLRYNRARQESITNDLLDIVSGAIFTE